MSLNRPPPPRRPINQPIINQSDSPNRTNRTLNNQSINQTTSQSIDQSNNQYVRTQSNHQQIRTNGNSYDQSINNPPINQSTNQSINHHPVIRNLPNNQLNIHLNSQSVNQPINHSNNYRQDSISQSINQSINQEPHSASSSHSSRSPSDSGRSVNQSVNQSTNDSKSPSEYQRIPAISRKSTNQSNGQIINQSIHQSTNQARRRKHESPPASPQYTSINQSTNQSTNQSINQSVSSSVSSTPNPFTRCINQSISQSMNQSTRKKFVRWQRDHPKLTILIGILIGFSTLLFIYWLIDLLIDWHSDSKKLAGVVLFSVFQSINQSIKESDSFVYASQMSALYSWDQSINQSNIQLIVPSMETCTFLYSHFPNIGCHARDQSINQSIDQSINQSVNQLSMRAVFDRVHESVDQSINQFIYVNNDVLLSKDSLIDALSYIDQSINQSIDQSIDQFSMIVGSSAQVGLNNHMVESINQSIDQSINQLLARADTKPIDQSINQSIDWLVYRKSAFQSIDHSKREEGNVKRAQSINQAINQPINQFPDLQFGSDHWKKYFLAKFLLDDEQLVIDGSQSIKSVKLINHSVKQSINHSNRQSIKQSIKQSINHNEKVLSKLGFSTQIKIGEIKNCAMKLIDQSINQSINQPINQSISQSTDQSATQSTTQSTDQSINQSIHPSINQRFHISVNEDQSDALIFARRASVNGYLTVLTINSGYIKLAMNWICWAERIGFSAYIIISEDYYSRELLLGTQSINDQSINQSKMKKRLIDRSKIPIIIKKGSPHKKMAADYGSVEFQETMSFRTEFLMGVLNAGYHFVTADMDGLWLDDPIQHFDQSADLSGQLHKEVKISGGFVVVRASTYGKFFWNNVIECQRENSLFLAKALPGSYEPSKYTEQYCINELSRSLLDQSAFKRTLLDRYLFPDGKSFFDEFNSQLRGIAPVVIHNNWIKGADAKLGRLMDWGLNSADDNLECIDLPPLPSLPPPIQSIHEKETVKLQDQSINQSNNQLINPLLIPPPVHVKIRILAFNRPASLRRLLKSLTDADYLNHRVTLIVSIDHPSVNPSDDDVIAWKDCLKLARSFEWTHGEKIVIEQQYNIGLIGQWIRGWQPDTISQSINQSINQTINLSSADDSTVMFFLEDDCSVSPLFYHYLVASLHQYYLNPSHYDGRLFGISLQRQNRILGETHHSKYGSRIPADTLARSPDIVTQQNTAQNVPSLTRKFTLYRYQLIGTWGTVFFPNHWREFQEWLTSKQVDINSGESANGFKPCVPALHSNMWYLSNPAKMWSQWFIRFAYEKGFYTLYSHFSDEKALVVNHREPGLNSKIKKDSIGNLVTHVDELIDWTGLGTSGTASSEITTYLYNSLPAMHSIPVYDFHFNHINEPAILAWRQSISNPKYIDQCWTLDKLNDLLRDRQLAFEAEQAEKQRIKIEKKRLADEANRARIKAEKDAKKLNETKIANTTTATTVKKTSMKTNTTSINQSIKTNTTSIKQSIKTNSTSIKLPSKPSNSTKTSVKKPAVKPKKLKSLTGDQPAIDPVVAHTLEQPAAKSDPVSIDQSVQSITPADPQSNESPADPSNPSSTDKSTDQPIQQQSEQPVEPVTEQSNNQSINQVELPAEQPADQIVEQPAEPPVEQAAEAE